MNQSRHLVRHVLFLVLAVSSTALASDSFNRKTFLSSRPIGVNKAMELTTWLDHPYKNNKDNHIHSHLQATGFYQSSNNGGSLGKYFGIDSVSGRKNSFIIGTQADVLAKDADIDNTLLLHSINGAGAVAPSNLAGVVTFSPRQRAAGFALDYFQDINHPIHRVFFKAHLPVAWVERNVRMSIADGVSGTVLAAGGAQSPEFSIQDFFAGNVSVANAGSTNLQTGLASAKINGRQSEGGIADLDLALGYKALYHDTHYLFLNVGITIPTGTRLRGNDLFEPFYGNGRHFGFGLGLDAGADVWCNEHANLRAVLAADYRYLFEGSEVRTVGLKSYPLGHYFLAAKNGQVNKPLFPAANVLTQPVRIKPGSQLDALVGFEFKSSNIILDAGYNLYWRDDESGWVKNWTDNVYALAGRAYSTATVFDLNTNPPVDTQALVTLNKSEFDNKSFLTPSLLSHKLYAGAGYQWMYGCNQCSVNLGGSYEFATTNADLENWSVWGKACVSF